MIEIVSETKFRSKPTVNMTDDMVRVVLDMPFMDWVVIKKSLIETEEWFDKCEEKREKKKEKEKDIEYYMKLPYKIIIEPIPKNDKSHHLAVDHNHETGELCLKCNRILGLANDSPSILRALADYLEQSG